jgi:uncharacterized repeat protein (TIGR01451 family)
VTCSRTIHGHGSGRLALAAHVTARTPDEAMIRDATAAPIQVIHPGLSLSVDASATSVRPGDMVTYTFVVTNTGDSVVRGIRVVQDRVGVVGRIGTLARAASLDSPRAQRFRDSHDALRYDDRYGVGPLRVPDLRADGDELDRALSRGVSRHGGGTAFTGSDAARAGASGLVLLILGGVALVVGCAGGIPWSGIEPTRLRAGLIQSPPERAGSIRPRESAGRPLDQRIWQTERRPPHSGSV